MDTDVVLASGSPRRRELLTALGWNFRVIAPQIDETPRPSEAPEALCVRLAAAKSGSVAVGEENALVIAADTVVVVDGDVLGKPRDVTESLRMILRLQGRTHQVLTGLSLRWRGRALNAAERTRVTFRPLDEMAARAYVVTGEGIDKAGAYAIQGKGSLLVSSIEGDYFNVVGLPLCRLGVMAEELELTLPRLWGTEL